MAATGKTPILLYGSTTATNVPVAGNLTNSSDGCEIAINVADKNLFFKDSTNTVNTVPIRQSSASSNGWLSSTDWTTFNNKQPAGTYVTSVTGTAPVVSSGGTTPAISMAAATGSVNGYLTSTDWTTFNNKQAALVSGTNIKTVGEQTILGSGDAFTAAAPYFYLNSTDAAQFGGFSWKYGIQRAQIEFKAGTAEMRYSAGYAGYGGFQTYYNNGVEDGRWDGAGNFKINNGNLVIGTSGKGIDFSATAGTGTSELLADYEEGTWTPSLGGTPTYVKQVGTYTKVGRVVTVNFTIQLNGATGASATTITGLPYTAASSSTYRQSGSIAYFDGLATAVTSIVPVVDAGGTSITFAGTTAAQSLITAGISVFTTYTYIMGTLTYVAA